MSGITVENGTFLTKSLKHLEANAEEMPIAGLLGMDILGGYDIIYDYDTKKLTLIDSQAQIRLSRKSDCNNTIQSICFRLSAMYKSKY